MSLELEELQKLNERALLAVDNSIIRLGDLSGIGTLSQRIAINAQFSRAVGDKAHLRLVRAHLAAAETIIAPIDPDIEATLDTLAGRLDEAILDDFKLNATLAGIKSALSAAESIGGIISDHT